MVEFKGGRGKQAPYTTAVVRVPAETRVLIEAVANTYKELKALGKEDEIEEFIKRVESAILSVAYTNVNELPNLNEARDKADEILAQKKSAKMSLEKLLHFLYNKQN